MKYKYAAMCVALKNDLCLEESIERLFTQCVSKVLIVSPTTYWATGEPQSISDLCELQAIAARTGAEIVSKHYPTEGDLGALGAEGAYRNCGIEMLTEDAGVDYVVTLDADELWGLGALDHIDGLADGLAGTKITLPAIPVIGVPGLPVEGATDSILVATSRGVRFTWGRAVDASRELKGNQPVIHFSATRKTIEEVVTKHRASAHYADPTYDFEGWIANTLPTIKVGSTDVHMYLSSPNIWPAVRAWTAEEISTIPKTLIKHIHGNLH